MNKRIFFIILFLIIIISFNITGVRAEQSYRIDNFIVEMDVNNNGDFIITEEIEYNFLDGEFSTAFREIPGRGFSSLEFVSIAGIGTPILDHNVSDGSELEIEWEYPITTEQAIFRIEYIGKAGLISSDGRNLVDWQVVGTDWEVPIENAEVRVSLAEAPADLELNNGGEADSSSGRDLYFQRQNIEPEAGWRLSFDFREQIDMPEQASLADYSSWLIGLIIIALILMIYRIIDSYKIMKTAANSLKLDDNESSQFNKLSFPDKLLLHDYTGAKGARMLAALIFHLSKLSLIKLRIEVKDKFFGGEKAVIKIFPSQAETDEHKDLEVYGPLFEEIGDGDLKLEKVISKTSVWKKILDNFKNKTMIKDWESDYRKNVKKKSLYLALLLTVIFIGTFLDFVISSRVITFLPAVFSGILAVGEFIRYTVIVPLTDTAIKMREKIDNELAQRRDRLEELVETDSFAALELILNNLSWLLVDNKMTGTKFKKYREKIEKNISEEEAESLELPQWLAVDGIEGALKAIEVVEYTMTAVYAAVASTSATAGGAAGGGAGGGGGGAA